MPAQDNRTIDSLLNFIEMTSNDTLRINALINLSSQFRKYQSDKILKYRTQALTLSVRLRYPKKIAYTHNKLGDFHLNKGDFGSATVHYFSALKIYEEIKDSVSIARNYNNIGQIFYYQTNYNAALNYYYKSLAICNTSNDKQGLIKNYNDIGVIYTILKRYDEALQSYNSAMNQSKAIGNMQGQAACYANISLVYYEMGKHDLAIETTKKAIIILKQLENKESLLSNYSNIGAMYIITKNYAKAAIALQKAKEYINEVNDKTLIKSVYDNFSNLYEKKRDFEKAFEYASLSSAIKDSIYNESNNKQASEMTAKYESEKKELLIDSLKKDAALSEEKLEKEKNFKIYLLLFCVLIAASAFVLFRSNIQKKKANQKLSHAYEEIEEKNKDITDSINYSKRIQDASLPSKELRLNLFPETFILFKPKDIVSGDFYWYADKNGKRLIACCDCTGHGVPGALMSMIGNNMLNQIVNEKGITSPEEILNQLHKEVRKALKQEEQAANKDGMDIALVAFVSETEIEYAGANRPLWIIKAQKEDVHKTTSVTENDSIFTTTNTQLIEIKPDKFSIGGQQTETERKFFKHSLSLKKGDAIYLFSDGFVDQFGGPEGKKYMSKRFKELLFANYTKPMNEQENILANAMADWKANHAQVDDILVVGIKI